MGIGVLSPWAVVLIYDADGTVLQDRSYIDRTCWPSGPKYLKARELAPQEEVDTAGVMDGFYAYQKSRQTDVSHTDLEQRNLSIIEGSWLDAQHNASEMHQQRFRMQWPLQFIQSGRSQGDRNDDPASSARQQAASGAELRQRQSGRG